MTISKETLTAIALVLAALIAVAIFYWKPWDDNKQCGLTNIGGTNFEVCWEE